MMLRELLIDRVGVVCWIGMCFAVVRTELMRSVGCREGCFIGERRRCCGIASARMSE
jgi:hypothetical protein